MRILIVAALAAIPLLASGQTLYRCVEKGKPTTFQQEPCPVQAKTASVATYTPDPNARPYRPDTTRSQAQQQSQGPRGAQLHNVPMTVNESACEAAKARRAAVVGRNNQSGDVNVRRQLNDAVARACY